jgi:DNA-binding transcriptional MerR regulator
MEMLNVPPDEELFKRQYYSMREAAAMFNVNQALLRFWENEFDILQPKKNKKGDRYFRPIDIKNLVLIYHLLRVRKFTMEGAKDYLQTHQKAADSFQLVQRLEKLKSFLLELKANL